MLPLCSCSAQEPSFVSNVISRNLPLASEAIASPIRDYTDSHNAATIEIVSEYLSILPIDEGYHITNCARTTGSTFDYAVYEMKSFDESGSDRAIYWVVVVIKDGEVFEVLRQNLDKYAVLPYPHVKRMVLEVDVDFDGNNDVLIWLGRFGTQAAVRYACYLQRDRELEECPSFSYIPNPAVDAQGKVILSCWREWAASHSYAKFFFIDGEFVEKERLTEELKRTASGDDLWTWTDKVFEDGEWRIREYFTANDYDKDTLYNEKIYGETAYWDITSDRWRTLFNNGLMADFSIYS